MYKWWAHGHVKITLGLFCYYISVSGLCIYVNVYLLTVYVLYVLKCFCVSVHTHALCVCVCACVFVYLAVGTVATWQPLHDPWEACRRRGSVWLLSHDPLLPSLSVHNGVLIWRHAQLKNSHTCFAQKKNHTQINTSFVPKFSVLNAGQL